jgi:serine/threonine-protein kinase
MVAAVLVGFGAVLAPAGAVAQNYGAIAYSPSTGADGWAFDYPSRAVAERNALQDCRKYADDCAIQLWFRDACGALAVGDNGYGTGWGTDRRIAESYAIQTCRKYTSKCAVRRWVCTSR